MKGPSPELAWSPQVGSYLTVSQCVHVGENRHGIAGSGNLGTYGRDGNSDNPPYNLASTHHAVHTFCCLVSTHCVVAS